MNEIDISWKKVSETPYKAGFRNMLNRAFQLPNGNEASFDLLAGQRIVCVLAFTTDAQVILTKQFRPAQERILIEIPGGGAKTEETPEQAAARELLEETGYSGKLEFVCTSLQSAYDTSVRYNFVAIDCIKVSEPQLEDNGEPILVHLMSVEQFKSHLHSGEITDVATGLLGLNYLKLL